MIHHQLYHLHVDTLLYAFIMIVGGVGMYHIFPQFLIVLTASPDMVLAMFCKLFMFFVAFTCVAYAVIVEPDLILL